MRISTVLLVFVVCALSTAASPQTTQPPFSLNISADKFTFKAGSDVYINIQMTNTSNHNVDCTMNPTSHAVDRAYQYEVHDINGHLIKEKLREHPEIGGTFQIWPCTLKPGQTTHDRDNLISRIYDLSRPGTYVIQVSRFIAGDDKSKGTVKSNKFAITVTP